MIIANNMGKLISNNFKLMQRKVGENEFEILFAKNLHFRVNAGRQLIVSYETSEGWVRIGLPVEESKQVLDYISLYNKPPKPHKFSGLTRPVKVDNITQGNGGARKA